MAFDTKDTKVGTHEGVGIYLRADGDFWATADGWPRTLHDKTLDGLKKKIEERARRAGRAALSDVVVLARVVESNWDGDEHVRAPRWIEGRFVSVNGHTGDVTLLLATGEKQTHSYVHLFRADDPAIETMRRLDAIAFEAGRAKRQAEKAVNAALKEYGIDTNVQRRYREDKSTAATRKEQEISAWLAQRPELAPAPKDEDDA